MQKITSLVGMWAAQSQRKAHLVVRRNGIGQYECACGACIDERDAVSVWNDEPDHACRNCSAYKGSSRK